MGLLLSPNSIVFKLVLLGFPSLRHKVGESVVRRSNGVGVMALGESSFIESIITDTASGDKGRRVKSLLDNLQVCQSKVTERV